MKFLIHVMKDRRAYKPHEPVEVVAKWHFFQLDTNHNGVSDPELLNFKTFDKPNPK